MTDAPLTPTPTQAGVVDRNRTSATSRAVLPLWIAAISLALIAVVLIIVGFQLLTAVHTAQGSVVQLQQQVQELKTGLGGLLGG